MRYRDADIIRKRGFTLVETLAAMLFMAILIPVAMQGVMVANRTGIVAERKRVAAQLADQILTNAVVTEEWRNGSQQGDFGNDWPGYNWTLEDAAWDVDALRILSVKVEYEVQGKIYEVILSTLVPEEEEVEETEV